MARTKVRACCGCVTATLIAALGGAWFAWTALSPSPPGSVEYVRFSKPTRLHEALGVLSSKGLVRSSWVTEAYARISRGPVEVKPGTYKGRSGMSAAEALAMLREPVKKLVRIPEGWWIARTAARLEKEGVCKADDYVKATRDPSIGSKFKFLAGSTAEGFLFPDTYNLPPLTPASDIVQLQLKTFEGKVAAMELKDQRRTVTIASLVELEAAKDSERARIAGVIENRLARGMKLEIDATVLYALQEWKQLSPGVVRTVKNPYNTYLNPGLPPGPIGSPSLKSIEAAAHPEKHGYLYYVARPDRTHYFSSTYPDHLANIRKARAEWKAAGHP
ncbi:MAG: endolytic transglycosylase MltG [Armatimonadetes bacterium]|nr:endolytic transglycosylase MltG [Armatimonadota bacterium]